MQKSELTSDMFCQKLGTEQDEEMHNLPHISKDGFKAFNPKLPEVVNFLSSTNAEIDWSMRMPTDPPLVDPKAEKLPELCEEEVATLEPTFPVIDNQLPH